MRKKKFKSKTKKRAVPPTIPPDPPYPPIPPGSSPSKASVDNWRLC